MDVIDHCACDFVIGAGREGDHLGVSILAPGGLACERDEGVHFWVEDAVAVGVAPELDAGALVIGERQEVGGNPAVDIVEVDRHLAQDHVGGPAVGEVKSDDCGHCALIGGVCGVGGVWGVAADGAGGSHEELPRHLHILPGVVVGEDERLGLSIRALATLDQVHLQAVAGLEWTQGRADVGGHVILLGAIECRIEDDQVGGGQCQRRHHAAGAAAQDDNVLQRIVVAVGIVVRIDVVEVVASIDCGVSLCGGELHRVEGILFVKDDRCCANALCECGVGVDDRIHPWQRVCQVCVEEDGFVSIPDAVFVGVVECEAICGGEALVGVGLVDAVDSEGELAVCIDICVEAGGGACDACQLGAQRDGVAICVDCVAECAIRECVFAEEADGVKGDRD